MKRSILLIAATLSLSVASFAQTKTTEPVKAPCDKCMTLPAKKDSAKVEAPATFTINNLNEGQIGAIYQIFSVTKECLPYNDHIADAAKINIIKNIDSFSDFLSKNIVKNPVDTAKKVDPPIGKPKKSH